MIYLDSAATSLYKPESVQYAVLDAINHMASPGRGAHHAAMSAADCCYTCREALAQLFHVPEPDQVVFTFNATHGLNIAIRSLVKRSTHVLISGYEHNSVTRPLTAIGAAVRVIDTPLFSPEAFLRRMERELPWAEVVICTHVSNAFGYVLPVESAAALCRRRGIPLIVDASQSAGILDLDFQALGAEFIAMPGHKGLMGPQGTGVLLCKNDAIPLLYGGSGSASMEQTMPAFLPDRLEAGTHNVAGIAGLLASVKWLLARGCESVRRAERQDLEMLAAELNSVDGMEVFYTPDDKLQSSVLSVRPGKMSCEAFADALDEAGVAVRTGLHCAPAAHRTVGTLDTGTVRFSFSPFLTGLQMEQSAEICKNIMKKS